MFAFSVINSKHLISVLPVPFMIKSFVSPFICTVQAPERLASMRGAFNSSLASELPLRVSSIVPVAVILLLVLISQAPVAFSLVNEGPETYTLTVFVGFGLLPFLNDIFSISPFTSVMIYSVRFESVSTETERVESPPRNTSMFPLTLTPLKLSILRTWRVICPFPLIFFPKISLQEVNRVITKIERNKKRFIAIGLVTKKHKNTIYNM